MRKGPNLGNRESGQVLVFVTITLMLAALVIPPLLTFIGGAGRTAQIREDRMLKVYAADAGIEHAYFNIANGTVALPQNPGDTFPYTLGDINGYDVDVSIRKEAGERDYLVTSRATGYNGGTTRIEAFVSAWNYGSLLDNALTSNSDLTLKNNTIVEGNVSLNGERIGVGWKDIDEDQIRRGVPGWPDSEQLIAYYEKDVLGFEYFGSSITVMGNEEIGPLYVDGDLVIESGNASATLTLTGTVYVTGNLLVGQKAKKDFKLDLNGQTIFSEQEITVIEKCDIIGSGCIIGLGDVYFGPKAGTRPGDFVFIMSVHGQLLAQPNGAFYGSMAGQIDIVKAGTEIYHPGNPDLFDLNFPEGDTIPSIQTYRILD